ncbi:hypothetical protein FQR65_LT10356 [Abscondita terminalis]|nr:hypothetical protein FQR65_LT10356 [Abscondita terminalis]
MYWIYCILVGLFLALHQANSSGVFELRLKSFDNEAGKEDSGKCCSGNSGEKSKCSDSCHPRFRVCLKEYRVNIDPTSPCTFGDVTTSVLGPNFKSDTAQDGFDNSIRFSFPFTWPGTFSLIVEAWHGNLTANSGVLISRLMRQRWLEVKEEWTEDVHRSNYSTLGFEYRVTCDPHYYGKGCENFCRPRDDNFGHYTCSPVGDRVCLSGWTGDYCTKARCLPGCDEQHGHCSKPNECKCQSGWEGPLCDECQRYPGCMHGTCVKPWDCLCNEGWGGLFCNQDLNFCTNHKPCRNGGTCFNTGEGSYTCSCSPDFTGTECETSIHDCTTNPCFNGGTCSPNGTYHTCVCPRGFQGPHCEVSVDTCEKKPCKNTGLCIETDGGYKCKCKAGFVGNNCEQSLNSCSLSPCKNNASCVDSINGFRCVCQSGFTGDRCETNIDDCQDNPCLNGGSCIDKVNEFYCQCVPGYVGSLCQTRVDYCTTKPCANGGTCIKLTNDYRCKCTPGFMGKDCSAEIDECQSHPCQNGGTCVNRVNGFECHCLMGYAGRTCHKLAFSTEIIDECKSHPCQHGGTCVNQPNGFECHCVLGYSGRSCEEASSSVSPSARVSSKSHLTTEHVVAIATISTFVPFLVLVAVGVIVCLKQRRKREKARADEEARLQNEQNTAHSSFAKGGATMSTDSHMIKNSWGKCTNNVLSSNLPSPDDCIISSVSVSDNDCFAKPLHQVIDGRSVYTLQRTRSQKQLNTEPGQRASVLLSAKLHEPEYEHIKRLSLMSNSSAVCGVSDPSLLKRPMEKEPGGVYVIEDHFHRADAINQLIATEV